MGPNSARSTLDDQQNMAQTRNKQNDLSIAIVVELNHSILIHINITEISDYEYDTVFPANSGIMPKKVIETILKRFLQEGVIFKRNAL